jgi:hypothetical protein
MFRGTINNPSECLSVKRKEPGIVSNITGRTHMRTPARYKIVRHKHDVIYNTIGN